MDKIIITIRHDAPNSVEKVELTEALALKMLDKWVKILHLEEWDLHLEWSVRAADMDVEGCLGVTSINGVSRYAKVQMLAAIDYVGKDRIPYDYEQTMVHELLHLSFWDMDDTGDSLRDKMTHVMIDRMARALVAAERSVD